MVTAASAFLLDIPHVQKDAARHPFPFFSFLPPPGHTPSEVVHAASFSISRQNTGGPLGPPQPLWWQFWCRIGVPGVSSPLLSWPPCGSKKRKGGHGIALGGCFCEVRWFTFLIGIKKSWKRSPFTNWHPSLTCWLLQLWSPYLQETSFISFLWPALEASVQP